MSDELTSIFWKGKNVKSGLFIQESKNRFLCEVKLEDGVQEECYVPSSCRLSNFADFRGCKVLLNEIASPKARTRYALYAIKFQRNYLLVNLKESNRIIAENILGRRFSFLGKRKTITREYVINGYQCDIFITDTNSVIEIKSVMALSKKQKIPVIYSERALQQLRLIRKLLKKGYPVYYFFVVTNPNTECLVLEEDGSLFSQLFLENVSNGMVCKAYSVKIKNRIAVLNKEIEFILPSNEN